ncbi:MAG: TIGR02300 family protein [Pseudomonadota bacterium]
MPKEEWGVKRVCPNCSTRFYDLQNDPMTCPACAHEFTLESLTGNKSRTMQADKPDAQNKDNIVEGEEEDVVLDDDDADDDADVDIDDDLLEEDEDDDTVSLDELADVASDTDDE